MKDYVSEKIRNVCLLSHGGAGKTSLTEAMLWNCGASDRFGKVVDGTTVTDYDPEEIKRKSSINTSLAPCEWKDFKINIIDTPGYFDFVGEVKEGIRVADSAIILVTAKDGVAVGTEKSVEYSKEHKIPKVFFISKLDEENANFNSSLESIKENFGIEVTPFQIPIMENEKFIGIIDIVNKKANKFLKDKYIEIEIPNNLKDQVDTLYEELKEKVAETSEELMNKFFDGEEFSHEEFINGIKNGINDCTISPVLCGSAINNQGIRDILEVVVELLPSPIDRGNIECENTLSNEIVELLPTTSEKLSALVFKTVADPFVGKISLIRVYSGTLKADSIVNNTKSEKHEKIASLYIMKGKKQIQVDKLIAGDIGCVSKLQHTYTNDTICDVNKSFKLEEIVFPEPTLSLAAEPKSKGDEEKIGIGLQKLQDEDPTFKVKNNIETKQTIISGIGEQHLEIIVNKLKTKFGVSINLVNPIIPYRETIKKKVKVEGKHKKQSGGHGQYGHVWIEFEKGANEDLQFEEKIFGGSVPKQYHPAVEKGLRESIQKGVLAGYPVVNLKATLVDGSYHDVDSSEMAFKIAAHNAFKKGLVQANPILLEPILTVEVYIPDSYMGDIIGDLNRRRGRILGMNPLENGLQEVVAEVPTAELFKYATDLRSMTQGRGYFKQAFNRYEEAPAMISQKVIEEAKKHMTEELD